MLYAVCKKEMIWTYRKSGELYEFVAQPSFIFTKPPSFVQEHSPKPGKPAWICPLGMDRRRLTPVHTRIERDRRGGSVESCQVQKINLANTGGPKIWQIWPILGFLKQPEK